MKNPRGRSVGRPRNIPRRQKQKCNRLWPPVTAVFLLRGRATREEKNLRAQLRPCAQHMPSLEAYEGMVKDLLRESALRQRVGQISEMAAMQEAASAAGGQAAAAAAAAAAPPKGGI